MVDQQSPCKKGSRWPTGLCRGTLPNTHSSSPLRRSSSSSSSSSSRRRTTTANTSQNFHSLVGVNNRALQTPPVPRGDIMAHYGDQTPLDSSIYAPFSTVSRERANAVKHELAAVVRRSANRSSSSSSGTTGRSLVEPTVVVQRPHSSIMAGVQQMRSQRRAVIQPGGTVGGGRKKRTTPHQRRASSPCKPEKTRKPSATRKLVTKTARSRVV